MLGDNIEVLWYNLSSGVHLPEVDVLIVITALVNKSYSSVGCDQDEP